MVEILTATVLLGILSFVAIPNIVNMKTDAEDNLAISRAEAVNMGMAAYVQAQGRSAAATNWAAANAAARFTLIKPYLAFSPTTISAYSPEGFEIELPTTLTPLTKATLWRGAKSDNDAITY